MPAQDAAVAPSSGAQWESLRNELLALLDHVEDQVAGTQTPIPEDTASPSETPPPVRPTTRTRHSQALRSVRQAVSRLADREGEERPVMRESVVDAISQIRARQTGGAEPQKPAPAPAAPPQEFNALAQSLDAMGERIASFEDTIGSKLETLGGNGDISAQIGQLSTVIEMLAGAVGETGQIRRIEAQIGNLAELLATDRAAANDSAGRRIEELASTVEKLVSHQIETSAREANTAAAAEERQASAMALIDRNVRSIYDKIDALEAAQTEPDAQIEKLSIEMAALTEAVTANREPTSLLAKIDALSARIETIEAPSQDEADTLAQSVAALRSVIAETIEPRFAAIEDRLDAAPPLSPEAIETQLRGIARRVEETSAQLKTLAEMPEPAPGPDLDGLAERIAERTRALTPAHDDAEGIEKADLTALEERLARLFSASGTADSESAAQLAGVKSTIAQVDSRIARLEAMLDQAKAEQAEKAAAQPEPVSAAKPTVRPRRKPDDAMPLDPASGEVRAAALSQPEATWEADLPETPETVQDDPAPIETDKPFAIDPEAIERPAKPQSSFAERQSAFEHPVSAAALADSPAATSMRANFIEAARRSARQQPLADEEEPKSLIARALARFQRNEADGAMAPTPATERVEPLTAEETAHADPVLDEIADDEPVEKAPGFFARNKRALLLGTALVAVVLLTLPLALDRSGPSNSVPQAETAAPAPAVEDTPEPAPAEPEPTVDALPAIEGTAPVEDTPSGGNDLMSGVRVIEQQTSLSAARLDADTLSSRPTIDPVQTASIGSGTAPTPSAEAPVSASLPEISVPEGIEPQTLRVAAETGDRFAQFEIGAILTEGTAVAQDFGSAAAWYERSAAQGFAPAQYRLGSLYEGGRGVERDLDMARLWYLRAAEAGNRMSMHNLASLYAGGELDTQDFSAAAHWFEAAADQGLTDSQFNLGMLYARGLGVEQDFEQSYLWFSLAARSGDQDAAGARDDVARSLDTEIVQRLNAEIESWTPQPIDMAANFAPIGTWDEAFDPGPAVTNSDVILRVQMLLGKLGYDVGRPDGIAGPRTREAIADFERSTGMSESGAVNPRLLAVLGSQPV